MSPREVQGLQALAENHGGSLTINPETGLPEAGFLDKLLPAIIGFALAPMTAGTSLAFLGATPMASALTVGGLQTLRTGDIGKGIQAGLGAYGGASLGANLAAAGTGAISSEVGGEALKAAGLTGEAALTAEADQIVQKAVGEKLAASTPFESLSAGADVVKNDPMKYLKANAKPLMYAAGPAILAGESAQENMPKTTTGMIRPYSFDPYSGTYTTANPYQATPTRAAGGGLMGMDNGGYSPGQLDFTQRSEPVVRMAEGGVPGYATGGPLDVNNPIYQYFAKPETQALLAAGNDAAIAQVLQDKDWKLADVAKATGTQDKLADYSTRFVNAVAQPGTSAPEFLAATQDVGLQNKALEDALLGSGRSKAAQYALTHQLDDTAGIASAPKAAQDFYNTYGYTAGSAPGDQGGLEGLYANIGYSANKLQDQINAGTLTVAKAQNLSLAEMERLGINLADVEAATGKKFGNLFTEKPITKITGTTIIPGVNDYGLGGTNTSGNLEDVYGPALPPGVSGAGITTVNPNGTITTRPDLTLPMSQVRDDYVRGGGNLGYTSPTFASLKAVEDKYPLRGGSKQSYDFLTGKTDYDPVPYTKTGEIMKPYASSVLGIPTASSKQMYLFDPATKTYKINPDYAIPTYDKEGKKSLALTNQDVINYVKSPEYSNDDAFVSWMTANNLTPEQIAAATGMSIADVYKKIKKAKPVEAVADTSVTGQNDGGGGGGGDMADGGLAAMARGGMAQQFNLGDYSDGGRLLRGPGDGVSDSIPASIGGKRPARLADGEFVVPARIVSELGNGSTEAGARKLYAMMDRIQKARRGTVGRGRVAKNSRSEKYLPA
jgi:hypothetical protein